VNNTINNTVDPAENTRVLTVSVNPEAFIDHILTLKQSKYGLLVHVAWNALRLWFYKFAGEQEGPTAVLMLC